MLEVRETAVYANWLLGLRDRAAKARIDIRVGAYHWAILGMYAQSGKESPSFGFNSDQVTESISSRIVRSTSCSLQVETNPLNHRILKKPVSCTQPLEKTHVKDGYNTLGSCRPSCKQ